MSHKVYRLGLAGDSVVLVVDLPNTNSEQLRSWQNIASSAEYNPAESAYPGVNAEIPDAMFETITNQLSNLVKRYFGRDISSRYGHAFIGQV
jgi:hypothetical protein